jgi:anaerobic magnesium-protoporphyrin IX monomethyl ester cyclase
MLKVTDADVLCLEQSLKILLANPSCKQSISDKYEKYFIRAGSRWPHSGVKRKGTIPHYLPFPFYLAYSAAILKNCRFDVHTLDAIALDISEESFLKTLSDLKPDLMFFEVTTPTINYDLKLVEKIRAVIPEGFIAIGGAHATTFASQLMDENPSIDYIVKGEYEIALSKLAISIKEGKRSPGRGIIAREFGGNESLNDFPLPAYDMFPSESSPDPTVYWDGFCQRYPAIQMQSSRGCPYRCYFCLWNSVIYGHGSYRTIDPVRVVDQMEYLVAEYHAKEIYFDDDSFTISKSHVLSICDELLKRNIGVKWSCMADADHLDEQLLQVMSQSGCIGVKFGVESASERVLKRIGKPVDLEKVEKIVLWCRKLNIKSHATFAIGLLHETEDDMRETLRFAQNLGVNSIQISIATPFPGTKFYDVLNASGRVDGKEWETFDGKISTIANLSSSCRLKAEKLRKRAMLVWMLKTGLNPKRLIHHLHFILRTIRGMGARNFCRKLSSTLVDEFRNG